MNLLKQKIDDIGTRWSATEANRLKTLGSCIGLQRQDTQIDLEHLEASCYQLAFKIPGGSHSIVYLNLGFGSYIIDPTLAYLN